MLGLSFSSCKNGDGITNSNDTDEPDPTSPPEISSSFENNETSFLPGEIQLILLENVTIDEDEYSAELADGFPVTLYRNINDTESKSLIFTVPAGEVGNNELIFEIEDQEQSLEFEIEEYQVIENPGEFVASKKTELADKLTLLVSEISDEETKLILNNSISDLESALEDFASLEEAEQQQIAYILKENLQSVTASKNRSNTLLVDCSTVKSKLQNSPKEVFAAATTGVTGGLLSGIKGTILNIFGTAKVFDVLSSTIDDIGYFISNCVVPELSIQKLKSVNETYTFNHSESQTFNITSSKTLTGDLETLVQEIETALDDLISALPDSWTEYLFEDGFSLIEPVEAESLSLATSEQVINGEITSVDNNTSLSFSFLIETNPIEPKNFTFSLTDIDNNVLEVEATLNPPLPISYNDQFSVRIDSIYNDTLPAAFAASFKIESQPTYGTLSLIDETKGEFEYTPNNTVTGGTDTFTFSTTNSRGISEFATVTVNLVNPFAGTWVMDTFENGTPVGQYVVFEFEECAIPAGEWTINWETLNIGEQSWSYNGNYTEILYNKAIDVETCTVLNDEPNTSEDIPYGDSGTYTRNGDVITTTINGETETGQIIFINENKIKLGDLTYVRQ